MVEPHSSNFRVIITIFLGVRIFRKFTVDHGDGFSAYVLILNTRGAEDQTRAFLFPKQVDNAVLTYTVQPVLKLLVNKDHLSRKTSSESFHEEILYEKPLNKDCE